MITVCAERGYLPPEDNLPPFDGLYYEYLKNFPDDQLRYYQKVFVPFFSAFYIV